MAPHSLPLLLFLLFPLLAAASERETCRTDEDCSLNGVCTSGTCLCDDAWTGGWCQLLNFRQAPVGGGFRIPNTTTWGGSVLRDEEHGYVMYASKMIHECKLDSWKTNSVVVVATSSVAAGPYREVHSSIVAPPWAHNPQAIHVPNDDGGGTYCVFMLGDGIPLHGPPKDCSTSEEFGMDTDLLLDDDRRLVRVRNVNALHGTSAPEKNVTVTFVIRYSMTGPLGPWLSHIAKITDFPSTYSFPGNWNPSPIVLPDGRVRIMVHTLTTPWGGEVIVEAPDWKGPYKPITTDVTTCTRCEEDPFVWIDKRGHWHVLYHKMFDPPGSNPIPSPGWTGGHSYSRDGLEWSPIQRAYNTTVNFEDGTTVELLRRERPKLIFAADGVTPTHLSNGVISPENGGATYTLVVPLQTR